MNIQLTGDSLMARLEGYNRPLINLILEQNSPHRFYNTAISGNNTHDFLNRMEQEILSFSKMDKIFILLGANDLALNKQVAIEQFANNLEQIIKILSSHYASEDIYFISPPAVDETKQRYRNNRLIQEYAKALQKICSKNHCHFLDLYQAFMNHPTLSLPELTKALRDDGIHFGLPGYQLLGELILKKLI